MKLKATKHPITALQKKDNTMAAEYDHIGTGLHESLYSSEHPRERQVIIQPTEHRIECSDIQNALNASPNGAAARPDMIPTRLVRLLWNIKQKLYLEVTNRVLKKGMLKSWKTSSTILIPKAKMAFYTVGKSWRPIQLQLILAKVMERIITNQLTMLRLLRANMYSGRKNQRTTNAIKALNNCVTDNKPRNDVFTALDVEGGFDHLNLNRTCNIIEREDRHLAL